jgi:hydroxymethylpyrimidine/phosphomethylpyrimidine kinase
MIDDREERRNEIVKVALTIAGSDSGGGAGIQADLKTFEAHGLFGTTAITCVTAQNTVGVRDAVQLPSAIVRSQLEAVFDDFDVAAVKIGMLGGREIISLVAGILRERASAIPIILDPVMVATSGDRLLLADALDLLVRELIPLATLITPNIPEAELLANRGITTLAEMHDAIPDLHELGARAVLLKGGHLPLRVEGEEARAIDLLSDGEAMHTIAGPYIDRRDTHGTGCTLSSAIAANVANGLALYDAVVAAKRYVRGAIEHAPGIGGGHGPLLHAWERRR